MRMKFFYEVELQDNIEEQIYQNIARYPVDEFE